MARISVQAADFDIGAEFAAMTAGRTDIGGIGCFVGTVRSNAQDRVAAMTLEHYPAMTSGPSQLSPRKPNGGGTCLAAR